MQYLSFYYFNVANLFCFIRYGSTDNKKKKKEKSIDRAFMRKHITIFTLLHAVRHSKETYHKLN